MRSRVAVVLVAFTLVLHGCEKNPRPPHSIPAPASKKSQLVDLSTSLAAARAEFNAHRGEARFLTLLSPT